MARKDRKTEKREDWDDGRTVAPMTGEELPPSRRMAYPERGKRDEKGVPGLKPTKEERRALMRGMFLAMLPRLLVILAGFGIAAVIAVLWLM